VGVKLGLSKGREEIRFESSMLREIFGPNRNEVIDEWRKLQTFNSLYSLPNIFNISLSKHHTMNMYWGVDIQLHTFLIWH
jgi:hypothetical protein